MALTARNSYKERFGNTKAELVEVVKEKRKLEEEREILQRDLVYSMILNELHQVWWVKLPEYVKRDFIAAGMINSFPSFIASWFLQWHEFSPSDYPLPPSLRHFGPVMLRTRARFIFNHGTYQESNFSRAVGHAWAFLPDTIRQLMLFSWAGVQSVRSRRNGMAHLGPDLGTTAAREILDHDFHNTFPDLHAAACDIADYLFDG